MIWIAIRLGGSQLGVGIMGLSPDSGTTTRQLGGPFPPLCGWAFLSLKCQSQPVQVVQWLRGYASNAEDVGLIPGQGTRFHMPSARAHLLRLRSGTVKLIIIKKSVSPQSINPAHPSRSSHLLICEMRAALKLNRLESKSWLFHTAHEFMGRVIELPWASVSLKWQAHTGYYMLGIVLNALLVPACLILLSTLWGGHTHIILIIDEATEAQRG